MDKIINAIDDGFRSVIGKIAKVLNKLSGGRISPNSVTITALIVHIPIAWLVATQHNLKAALLLMIFGLFDSLDGALARMQHKAGNAGMLLDASADRMKEILLYTGAAYAFVTLGRPYMTIWAVLACGGSLLVSYVKAKGETAVAGKFPTHEVNKLFQDGVMRFEIRMFILFLGLLSNHLIAAVVFIAVASWLTAFQRLIRITKKLNSGV
jgi:phosphatidylglycerophosphate synthase